ncbi:MAG TPA: carboxypeptidase regulatory-like domain-containing protein, partial [Candidatus Angelobacter sp.]|nr:carboxypeptidase regulatory-like domain-containing protein [Candidatus Angelobacter sp.]
SAAGQPASPISSDTDASGHFSLQLAPGTYRLWVERNGFARQIYGALSPAGEGSVLTLAPGQQLHDVAFKVVPLGAIAGRVVDEDGEPVQGVGIQVLRLSYINGYRQLISVAGATSNDRGEYRVFGLPANRYLLLASLPNGPMSRPMEAGGLVPEVQDPFSPLYYPGVPDVDSASPVSLAEGAELADMNFQLRKVRALTVRGRLVSSVNKFLSSQIQVVLAHNENGVASYIDRVPGAVDINTGKFEIRGVSPGSYLIVASQFLAAHSFGGRVPLEVSAATAQEQVSVPLSPAFDIPGVVEVEGAPRGSLSNLIVRLLPSEGLALGPTPSSRIASDGSIRLQDVTPGLWRVVLDSLPEDLWVKTESFAGNEVPAGELVANESTRGELRIVLAGNGAQISGTVTFDNQPCRATVVLVPAAPELRAFHQFYRVTNASEHGTFSLKGVRPGSYLLFAFQEIEPFAWFDPELLHTVENMGVPLIVNKSDNVTRDVVAIQPEALLPH